MPEEEKDKPAQPLENTAFEKLARKSVPVRILKNAILLAEVRGEIEGLQRAKDARSKSSVLSFFKRDVISNQPLEIQIQALKMREKDLAENYIEGVLAPITEAESWEIRAGYGAVMNTLRKSAEEYEGEARAAYLAELKKIQDGIWVSKFVEVALKMPEKKDGVWVRYSTRANPRLKDTDPTVLDWLFGEYHRNFTLTDEELKKSAASTNQAS